MFLSTSSGSFNFTSIEKKLAAIETTSSSSFTPKAANRLRKVNNESELDAFLKSERANFNDEQFEYLTQQVMNYYLFLIIRMQNILQIDNLQTLTAFFRVKIELLMNHDYVTL